MIKYLKLQSKKIMFWLGIIIFINLYLLILCASQLYIVDLLYLDIILMVLGVIILLNSYNKYKKIVDCNSFQKYLPGYLANFIDENNDRYMRSINDLNQEIHELSDYISKWSHEAKLPIASLRLMNERNQDIELQKEMRFVIEKIQLLINTMMLNCKLKNSENDIKIEKISLIRVIKNSIKNQSYFLIDSGFEIKLSDDDVYVYSDRRWLTYIIDQLITNAIKYKQANPKINFEIINNKKNVVLKVIDNGIGVTKEDAPYIFDRGYIGNNLRDGDYRSTGMGLYFVKEIADRLNLEVDVDLVNKGSCFRIVFRDMKDYFFI